MVFHVLNRGVGRMNLFAKDQDYAAFLDILRETLAVGPTRLCAFCLMPNHWHFVVWPSADGELAAFFQRLTVTHAARWQRHRRRVGYGHVYQGRYKSFPVEADEHYYQVVRYVERNALRANLVERAEAWSFGSLHLRNAPAEQPPILSPWPIAEPASWTRWATEVNQPQTESELAAIRRSVIRGRPLGSDAWVQRTAEQLGLAYTLRAPGRPRKSSSTP
jgi:putative transposase